MSSNVVLQQILKELRKPKEEKLSLKSKWHLSGWDEFKVPTNKIWEVLSGAIYHVNGGDTELLYQFLTAEGDNYAFFMDRVLSAEVTNFYPLDFHGSRLFLNEWDYFIFSGAAGSGFSIRYIERDVR